MYSNIIKMARTNISDLTKTKKGEKRKRKAEGREGSSSKIELERKLKFRRLGMKLSALQFGSLKELTQFIKKKNSLIKNIEINYFSVFLKVANFSKKLSNFLLDIAVVFSIV